MNKEEINATGPEEVDAYINGFPKKTRVLLEQMRGIIKAAAPDAREVISYRMPAYKQKGILVYFAAYKNHIGFYPTSSGVEVFRNRLGAYKTSKGAVQFPLNQPLPVELITEIVWFRLLEDQKNRCCCP
jgi:uncharacterized protein YdhG (YjbR/CyaY superfamily)